MNRKLIMMLLMVPLIANSFKIQDNILIQDLNRSVDATGVYMESKTKFILLNNDSQDFDIFYHIIPQSFQKKLFYVELSDSQTTINPIVRRHLDIENQYNLTVLEFKLTRSVHAHSSQPFVLTELYYGRYDPLPTKIEVNDDQLVVVEDNILFPSAYHIEQQQTHFKVKGLKSYSQQDIAVERGQILEYKQFFDKAPFTVLPVTLHFENNSPLGVLTRVKKTIEVSHWGNIAVLEEYELSNQGAKLAGEFGRVMYNRYVPTSGKNAIKGFESHLPIKSWGVYYKDEIGNISTSNAYRGVYQNQKQVIVKLQPRFPILGGWRSNFQLGYNLPTLNSLQVSEVDPNLYVLTQDFGFSLTNLMAEVYELEIILPEGSTEITYQLPRPIDQSSTSLTFSYLDVTGRPTINLKKNLVSYKDLLEFKVQYKFQNTTYLRKPFLIFAAFIVLFAILITVGRVELVTFKLKQQ